MAGVVLLDIQWVLMPVMRGCHNTSHLPDGVIDDFISSTEKIYISDTTSPYWVKSQAC